MANLDSEYQIVRAKNTMNKPLSYRELAILIACEEPRLLKFIADNDPIQAYKLLHISDAPMVIGHNADFAPNAKRVDAEFYNLLKKKDWNTLNQIISAFRVNMNVNNYSTNQNILRELRNMGALVMTPNGEKFNLQFNS